MCTIRKYLNLLLIDQSFELSDEKRKKLQDKATTLEKPIMTLTCHGKPDYSYTVESVYKNSHPWAERQWLYSVTSIIQTPLATRLILAYRISEIVRITEVPTFLA